MADLDIERGIEYFQSIRDSIKETYVDEYGKSEEEALKIATRTAMKVLYRRMGPEWAMAVINEAKKRGLINV